MAMVGLRVPAEIGRLLAGLQVDGQRVPPNHYHVTLLNLGDDLSVKDLLKATQVILQVVSQQAPFTLRINEVTHFPKGEDGYPVVCRVGSPVLTDLHGRLWDAFEAQGIEFSKDYPDFKGHITLSYAEGAEPVGQQFPVIEWGVAEIVLWGGDKGDERLVTSFPLSLQGSKTAGLSALYRAAVRLSGQI